MVAVVDIIDLMNVKEVKKNDHKIKFTKIQMVGVVVIINLMNITITEVNKKPIMKSKPKVLRRRVANIMVLMHIILRKSVTRIQKI